MLNLEFLFKDAIQSLRTGADMLQIPSLPVSVFMMQQDLLNHYEYAINHYFNLTLNDSFLQNSSLGTPYQKWKKFTNYDFKLLFFTIRILTTFTSRLYHESDQRQRIADKDFDTLKKDSNRYTKLICEFKYKNRKVGIEVNENETLTISSIVLEGVLLEDGNWTSISSKEIDISNRSVLKKIVDEAKKEIDELDKLKNTYIVECKKYISERNIFLEYKNIHRSYWV